MLSGQQVSEKSFGTKRRWTEREGKKWRRCKTFVRCLHFCVYRRLVRKPYRIVHAYIRIVHTYIRRESWRVSRRRPRFLRASRARTPKPATIGRINAHWRALFSASESVHTREGERTYARQDIVLRSRNAIRNSFAFKTARQAVVPSPRLTLRAPLAVAIRFASCKGATRAQRSTS